MGGDGIGMDEKVGREEEEEEEEEDESALVVLDFLDSMDSYLTLFHSLSSSLRQGWMELASARHSMGVSRINSALFDLKSHSAPTSLLVSQFSVDSVTKQPQFALCKWASPDNPKDCSGEAKFEEDELLPKIPTSPQLRQRGTSQGYDQDKGPESNGSPLTFDSQVQLERSKSLKMFGTLVSPKLRTAQLTFETALERLVEIANMRSSMLSAYDRVRKEMQTTTE